MQGWFLNLPRIRTSVLQLLVMDMLIFLNLLVVSLCQTLAVHALVNGIERIPKRVTKTPLLLHSTETSLLETTPTQ